MGIAKVIAQSSFLRENLKKHDQKVGYTTQMLARFTDTVFYIKYSLMSSANWITGCPVPDSIIYRIDI